MRQISTSCAVVRDPKDVIDDIWSGAEWNARWGAIKSFDVGYDDGIHQVAKITLDWQGELIDMEVVRFRTRPECIDFYCRRPPHPLVHQSGRWAIEQRDGENVLVALRNIELASSPNESGSEFQCRLDSYAERLTMRLSTILPRFAGVEIP